MPDTDALAKRLARWQREQADILETECDAGGSLHDVEHMRATADELDRLAAALSAARAEAFMYAAQVLEKSPFAVHTEAIRAIRALAAGQGGENG